MDDLGLAPLLDVVKVVKQLFNGSTSIEPHFAEWLQVIQDAESEVGSDNEQQHFDLPQVILHGRETNEEQKDDKKEERKERKKKEKEEKKERKKKQKEKKKKQKADDKDKKKEQKRLLKEAEKAKKEGLTAALAFMHSRGMSRHSPNGPYSLSIADIPALFQFDIDGDIGKDPNALTLWFNQPDLGLPSKEYYGEKEIRDLYRTTIEKMLFTIAEAEEAEAENGLKFPPWPWPPWGDDDGKKSENKTAKAARLSRQVLKFESDIAAATADLYVSFPPSGPLVSYKSV